MLSEVSFHGKKLKYNYNMENMWGIKISRISIPEEKLTFNQWVKQLNVSSLYEDRTEILSKSCINNQYNFSKLKQKNESKTTGA
jgi:hypothetical protein